MEEFIGHNFECGCRVNVIEATESEMRWHYCDAHASDPVVLTLRNMVRNMILNLGGKVEDDER